MSGRDGATCVSVKQGGITFKLEVSEAGMTLRCSGVSKRKGVEWIDIVEWHSPPIEHFLNATDGPEAVLAHRKSVEGER